MTKNDLLTKWKFEEKILEDKVLSQSSKLVLLRLLHHHNSKTDLCNPSEQTLSTELKISYRQVQRSIKQLKDDGWLSIDRQYDNSNVYILHWTKPPHDKNDSTSRHNVVTSRQNRQVPHDSSGALIDESINEIIDESNTQNCSFNENISTSAGEDISSLQEESITPSPTKNVDILPTNTVNINPINSQEEDMYSDFDSNNDAFFQEFWSIYPRKVSKKEARRIFDYKVNQQHVAPEAIIAGAKRYAAQMAAENQPQKYIKYPNFWLDDDRWEDEIIDPVLDKLKTSAHPFTDLVKESMRQDRLSFLNNKGKFLQ